MNSLATVRAGLLKHPIDNQVVVYDPEHDQIHLLDSTTAAVLELLEEGTAADERILKRSLSLRQIEASDDVLELALIELETAGLVSFAATSSTRPELSRRDVMKRVAAAGVAAFLIPAITTLTATPGYAQTTATVARCGSCTTSAQCQGGLTCVAGACGGLPNGAVCSNDNECCSNVGANQCRKDTSSSPNKTCHAS